MMVCQTAISGSDQESVFLNLECWSIGVLDYWGDKKSK